MPFRLVIASSALKTKLPMKRLLSSLASCTTAGINNTPLTAETKISPLIQFEAARLKYPSIIFENDDFYFDITEPFDLNIYPNTEYKSSGGGHVVLGNNGSGKSLLSQAIINAYSKSKRLSFLHSGSIEINETREDSINRNHQRLTHVSFESHSELLLNETTTTVHRALIPGGGNNLSPTAKFLAVRLGMYPLLTRYVNTLSTGEVRRVLLVRALVSKPELLLLDNAFDGLDVIGRKALSDIVERVLKGFRNDILVQGIGGDAKDTARTQIMLFSHRPEEISDGMGLVTYLGNENNFVSTEIRSGRAASELVEPLRSTSLGLPDKAGISQFWQQGNADDKNGENVLVKAENLLVTRDDSILLSNLDWVVQRGERWHVAGSNGSGKSTVCRLLLRISMDRNSEWVCRTSGQDAKVEGGQLHVVKSSYRSKRGGMALVSTELHLHAAQNWCNRTVLEVLTLGASFIFDADRSAQNVSQNNYTVKVDLGLVYTATKWLGLVKKDDDSFLNRKFSTLSQGEQKLSLIASALALRPSLLILDEPCQGLDQNNRKLVLDLIEVICQTTDMSLVYITHHNEELIPSINQKLHLEDGKVV